MKPEQEPEFLNYCNYCNSVIYDNEDYMVKNNHFYHLYCWKQMNTYYDILDNDEDIYSEKDGEPIE